MGIVFRIGAFQDSKVSNYCVGRPRLCFLIRWMLFPEFAGENYADSRFPENARAVLSHFDERSQHYEIRAEGSSEG